MSQLHSRNINCFYKQLQETKKRFDIIDDADRKNLLDFNQYSSKLFVLTVASNFETQITEILKKWIVSHSQSNKAVVSFFERKAIDRQYHTLFDWDTPNNVNRFLSFFGDTFRDNVKIKIQEKNLNQTAGPIWNFIYLGDLRNRLVHQNFMTFQMNDTLDDLKSKYDSATKFIEFLEALFLS